MEILATPDATRKRFVAQGRNHVQVMLSRMHLQLPSCSLLTFFVRVAMQPRAKPTSAVALAPMPTVVKLLVSVTAMVLTSWFDSVEEKGCAANAVRRCEC
eukprot:3113024-Amphidinium_carterae.2